MYTRDKNAIAIGCQECKGKEPCAECVNKVKNAWRLDIPLRYRDATLESPLIKSMKYDVIANSFIDKMFSRDHSGTTGLYISGDLGTGKTWLLYAIINKLIDRADLNIVKKPPFYVVDCKYLIFDFHYRYIGKGESSITQYIDELTKLTRNNLLIIDDLGHGNTTKDDFATNILGLLIDEIYVNKGFIATSSNHSLVELRKYIGPYAVDRIIELCQHNFIEIKGKSKRWAND